MADVIVKELDGPGRLLGYRATNQKLRTEHNIKVPRHLVQNMMYELDPEGVVGRNLQTKAKPAKNIGYQSSTFPIGVYGCMDTFSRKILFLFVCYSKSNPLLVGKKYLEYLHRSQMLPRFLRIDKGTETDKMATMQTYLMDKCGIMVTHYIQ